MAKRWVVIPLRLMFFWNYHELEPAFSISRPEITTLLNLFGLPGRRSVGLMTPVPYVGAEWILARLLRIC
jgi:hypothetical protein